MNLKLRTVFAFAALVLALLHNGASAQDVPNALLEVSVNGTVYKGEAEYQASGNANEAAATRFIHQNTIHVLHGGKVQLKVDLVSADGRRKNVTADPAIQYSAVSDWNVDVSSTGLVTQRTNSKYTQANLAKDKIGQIIIWYKSGHIFGYNSIQIMID